MTDPNGTHGRVRARGDQASNGMPEFIGVTLAGTEHLLTVEEALGLANAVILTVVDGEERNMTSKEAS